MYSKPGTLSPQLTAASSVAHREMHADIIRRVIFQKHKIRDSHQGKKLPEIYTVNSQNQQETVKTQNASNYSSRNPQRCIRPFQIVLQILGYHPLTRDSHDIWNFKLVSPVTFYSIFMYIVTCVPAAYEIYKLFMMADAGKWYAVSFMLRVTYFVEIIFVPTGMWLPFIRNASVQQKWIELESCYVATTQQPLRFKRLEKAATFFFVNAISIGCVLVTSGFFLTRYYDESPLLIILYSIPFYGSLMLDGYWAFTYILIGCMVHRINSSLKTQLQKCHLISGKKLAAIIRRHRIMWLQASQILHETNKSNVSGIVSHVVLVFLMLTFSVYNLVYSIASGWKTRKIVRVGFALIYLFELFILANAANFTEVKIALLLDVAAISPSTVNMRDYFVVNRSWLVNMMGSLIGFIIILAQV